MTGKGGIIEQSRGRQLGAHPQSIVHEHSHSSWVRDAIVSRPSKHQQMYDLFAFEEEIEEEQGNRPRQDAEAWKGAFRTAMEVVASRQRDAILLQRLEREVAELRKKIESCQHAVVPIRSLAAWGLEVIKDIPAVVQATDGEYIATFFDANIAMSGDTQEEAVGNLRALIADIFESLVDEESILGPEPARQLATLREFIKKRA